MPLMKKPTPFCPWAIIYSALPEINISEAMKANRRADTSIPPETAPRDLTVTQYFCQSNLSSCVSSGELLPGFFVCIGATASLSSQKVCFLQL